MHKRTRSGTRLLASSLAALLLVAGLVMALPLPPASAATVGTVGPSYTGTTAPTGQKPQSKLWFAEGQWWGVLWDVRSRDFHIFGYDWAVDQWTDTGVLVDERSNTYVDALWDGSSLYIASAGTSAGSATHSPRLIKFTYDPANGTWLKAAGFPINIGNGGVEAAVIAKDSIGVVWATYTQGAKVWVTHSSAGDDRTWVPRYQLPAASSISSVSADDISAIVAFDGNKIGVLWSNARTETVYWATHVDGAADSAWAAEIAYQRPEGSDDHINLKSLVGDPSGRVFAVVKTSMDAATDPLVNVLVLDAQGNWTAHEFATKADDVTRAILLIDTENRDLYVFAAGPCCSGGKIYYKKTSLDDPSFEPGTGAAFMESDVHTKLNNPTSTKQNLSGRTGLLVLAGDDGTKTYVHNRITLDSTAPPDTDSPETVIDSAPPPSTTATSAEFSFSANETGSSFRCALDEATATSCRSPVTYDGLATGEHTFSVYAVDPAGNSDLTPATYGWTIEVGPPPPPPPPPPALFFEDFSSGGFTAGAWDVQTGTDGTAEVVAGAVTPGDLGARLKSTTATGSTASIRRSLASPEPTLQVGLDVLLASPGSTGQTYALLKLYDSSGARVLSLLRDSTGQLTVLGKTGTSTAFAGPSVGTRTRLVVHASQNAEGLDAVSVTVEGTTVFTATNVDMGALQLQRLRVGDDSLRRAMDLRVDDIEVRR